MSSNSSSSTDPSSLSCPVDHAARETWLRAPAAQKPPSQLPHTQQQQQGVANEGGGQGWMFYFSLWSSTNVKGKSEGEDTESQTVGSIKTTPLSTARRHQPPLAVERTVSSIPRTNEAGTSGCPVNHKVPSHPPSSPNAETERPQRSEAGNWVYPSESQFFLALQRKGHAANATDMSVVVPIHNAVNERAWSQILAWETPYLAPCGGPKLHSFSGDSKKLTPKARIMSLLGYQRPFDRHDWVVDRCGTRVDYVIDFYTGKGKEGKISFYLDVRPKLNTWEGVKMRMLRVSGMV